MRNIFSNFVCFSGSPNFNIQTKVHQFVTELQCIIIIKRVEADAKGLFGSCAKLQWGQNKLELLMILQVCLLLIICYCNWFKWRKNQMYKLADPFFVLSIWRDLTNIKITVEFCCHFLREWLIIL